MNINIMYEVPGVPTEVTAVPMHEQGPPQHEEPPVIINIPPDMPVPHETVPPPIQLEIKPQIDRIDIKPKVEKPEKKKKEAIEGQAKEVIYRVIKFFESEKQNRGYTFPVENVVKRACAATGLSESTIKRIKRDGIKAEATQTKMTGPKKKRVRKTKVQLDYYQLCALRSIVNSYTAGKEVPTLGKILAAARNELNYSGGKESLRLILLNKLGIKFKKCEKKNKKPPEQAQAPPQQPQMQPMQQVMQIHPQMQEIKPHPDNMCMYTHMVPHVPPVSY